MRRIVPLGLILLLALTSLPAWGSTETTTIEDECGDAYSSATVDGERTYVEDPITPRGDIESISAVATPESLAITMDVCADIVDAPENAHGYNITWDVTPPSAEFVACDARLALRNRNDIVLLTNVEVDVQGTFEVSCDGPADGEPVATYERVDLVDVVLAEGEGYIVDGDTLTFVVDASTVGADAMTLLAPGAVLGDVEAIASGVVSSVYVTAPPHGATYGGFGERVDVGDLRIPFEDDEE